MDLFKAFTRLLACVIPNQLAAEDDFAASTIPELRHAQCQWFEIRQEAACYPIAGPAFRPSPHHFQIISHDVDIGGSAGNR